MTGTSQDSEVREFFRRFESASESLDNDTLRACFAEVFMAADPTGTQPVPLEGFLSVLPRRKEMFAAAGIGRVTLTDLTHISLDEHYVLVHTTWTAERRDATDGAGAVTLLSSYILRRSSDGLRIVFYLNHKDLADLLRPDAGHASSSI
jgi:hypothetical protein